MSEESVLKKPKPKPLQVSWMVSPSTPFLQLVAQEGMSEHTVIVQFVAYDKRFDISLENKISTKTYVAESPSEFRPSDGTINTNPYRLIRVCFPGEAYARVSPSLSDSHVIDESEFDWSDVPGRWEPGEDIFQYLKRQDQQWHQTGICPNPRIYHIEGSHWLNKVGSPADAVPRLHHYMILGHDLFIEVLAVDHLIIEGQMLDDW
jgi:hypothetical protein